MSDHRVLRSSAAAHSILNSRFDYTPAAETDLRVTFKRVRQRQAKAAAALDANSNVKPLRRDRA